MKLTTILENKQGGNPPYRLSQTQRGLLIDGEGEYWQYEANQPLQPLNKQDWLLLRYGCHAEQLTHISSNSLPSAPESYALAHGENDVLLAHFYQENTIYQFDNSRKCINQWSLDALALSGAVYDIAYQEGGYLWLAIPTEQQIVQIDLTTQQILKNLRSNNCSIPLNYPESVSIRKNKLYIANMGNRTAIAIDLNTDKILETNTFELPIWQYIHVNQTAIISTDTGIYAFKAKP